MFDITKLKEIRKKLNLTQHGFARYANVSQSLIAKIEANKIDPTYSKVKLIEEAINKLANKNELEARQIMNKDVIIAKPNDKVSNVIKRMNKYNISQLPVLDNENIIGLVSESSVIEKSNGKNINKLYVRDVAEDVPPLIPLNAKLSSFSSLFKFYPLVLVVDKGKLKGIITKSDIIRNLV